MKKTNALKLRQSTGQILRSLEKDGEPILVEKGRKPVAVLITLDDYQKRFVDREADSQRVKVIETIRKANIPLPAGQSSLQILRGLRE